MNFFELNFSSLKQIFFELFFLVSYSKLCEVYDAKRKKLKKKFLHRKKDRETVIGYTFRVGYIYRADFKLLQNLRSDFATSYLLKLCENKFRESF